MTTFLCIADIHENEKKLEQIVKFSKGCDAILDAGDDFDRWLNGIDESNLIMHKTLPDEHREIIGKDRRVMKIKDSFRHEYENKARIVNDYYRKSGIPVFATLGNHDPTFVQFQMNAVKYLLGSTAEFNGLTIAGLPATDCATHAATACPEFYSHLNWYNAIAHDGIDREPSDAAKNILSQNGTVDIFITHKTYRPAFHGIARESRRAYENLIEDYDIDSGAAAVNRKFKPRLNLFGHYHLPKPVWEKSNGQWFLCPGRSAAVKVAVREKEVVCFEALNYS
jgi:Icc-related predicted phosphoesterase